MKFGGNLESVIETIENENSVCVVESLWENMTHGFATQFESLGALVNHISLLVGQKVCAKKSFFVAKTLGNWGSGKPLENGDPIYFSGSKFT